MKDCDKAKAKQITDASYEYLKIIAQDIDNNEEIIQRHLALPKNCKMNMKDVFKRMIISSANRQMGKNVILKRTEKDGDEIGILTDVLFDFDHNKVITKYGEDCETLLNELVKIVGEVRKEKNSLWPKFCKTILSSGKFLNKFNDFSDFESWVIFFNKDSRSRVALPMIISKEVEGFGFALACDFLKEIGYEGFGKPDVHIKEIFYGLKLSNSKEDYFVFKDLVEFATLADKSPFYIDKLFWLCSTGNFHYDKIEVKTNRNDFIKFLKKENL
ncbi:MAG TPA: hypothetical protein PL056_11365 [bacterium]|mgnify:CR=1 FL=1|nr:hypothetical protein [bacterium]HPM47658.1 hypothetical protein [bacterium]